MKISSSLPCQDFWQVSIKTSKTCLAEGKSNNACDATRKGLSLQGSFNKLHFTFFVAKENSRVIDYSLNKKTTKNPKKQTKMLIGMGVIRINTVWTYIAKSETSEICCGHCGLGA